MSNSDQRHPAELVRKVKDESGARLKGDVKKLAESFLDRYFNLVPHRDLARIDSETLFGGPSPA